MRPEPGVARPSTAPADLLADALAEAAWSEADAALAQALADFDDLEGAADEAARADAQALLAQSLARAARKRGLTRIGALGGREAYDPERHELVEAGEQAPKTVRIRARGVARGGEILVKPRAGAWVRKRRS